MKGICPNCEKETTLQQVIREEEFNIRGESIMVKVHLFKCLECGEEFEDPNSADDPIAEAYDIYRGRKGMIQPDEIRLFRRKYGLSQKEFSDLLGWGGATLSRYENGALQSEAHDQILKLIMQPNNLRHLVKSKPNLLQRERREKLIEKLRNEEETNNLLLEFCDEIIGSYEPDILSGYKEFDATKFFNAILFFCSADGVLKTKLNKLLFYADFLHFKYYSVSITGARYARLPFGPVPDKYNRLYASLIEEKKAIRVDERRVFDYLGEFYMAQLKPDLSVFSTSELKILASVKEFFELSSSKDISEFSHKERGYAETDNAQLIAYDYAEYISIGI
jgi:putative zinc finger/helix-turn-helix YgiT family protein